MKQICVVALTGFVSAMALTVGAPAEDAAWTAEVMKVDASVSLPAIYSPLAKAAKKWRVCVLFPHMKDSIWLAVDYGIVEEAKRLGITADIYQAGGYENLPKQLSQFDDCLAGGYDAIVVGAISEAACFASSPKPKVRTYRSSPSSILSQRRRLLRARCSPTMSSWAGKRVAIWRSIWAASRRKL